jgi:hypothetical protein
MGIFKKAKEHLGIEDKQLLREGILVRGNVVSCTPTAMTTGREADGYGPRSVCNVTVQIVGLPGRPPYEASCLHAIPKVYLPQMNTPGAAIAVRVDPADPQHIELDLATDVPPAPDGAAGAPGGQGAPGGEPEVVLVSDDGTEQKLETHTSTYTAAEILEHGSPCRVDVLAVIPMTQTNTLGQVVTGLVLTVHRPGAGPYQAQIGTHIPPDKAARVIVGASLPAKWVLGPGLPTDVNLVTLDWPQI